MVLLGELFLCEVFLLGPGELFLRLRGSTMFRPPDGPAPQPPPENRNKRMRIVVLVKIVIIMKKSCLLRGSRSSVGPGCACGTLRRAPALRWRRHALRPPAALQQVVQVLHRLTDGQLLGVYPSSAGSETGTLLEPWELSELCLNLAVC